MLIPILAGLAALVLLFLVIVALRPADFRISRNAAVAASPGVLFGYVNDLHRFQEFSPWAKIDPAVNNVYEGPATGNGAVFKWEGNSKVGQGIMTIVESRPAELVRFRLEFLKPFKATNQARNSPSKPSAVKRWSLGR